jgi:ribosomal protein S18 acetylase RimI-like enzyme
MDYRIRRAGQGDYGGICELLNEMHRLHSSHTQAVPALFRAPDDLVWTVDKLREEIDDEGVGLLVAELDDEVAGVIWMEMATRQKTKFTFMSHLVVEKKHRQKGIGRSLIEAGEEWGKEMGAVYALLNVWEFNEGAVAFYEKSGYESTWRAMWKPLS